jgi:uncharacterized membrane protein
METTSTTPARTRSAYTSNATNAAILGVFAAGFLAFAAWSGSWYATWKALHVLMAIVWIGGALMIQLFSFRILVDSNPGRIAEFAKDVEFIAMRTFLPASLVLVVLGFVLMHQGSWDWQFWAVFALVVWALSFVAGAAFLGPESGRIGKLIEERSGVDAEIQARIERILLFSRVEMVLLALIAMDMVLKPGA